MSLYDIALIHPSRGRAKKSIGNVLNWLRKSSLDVQVIVSLDNNDPVKEMYMALYEGSPDINSTIIFYDNDSVVSATNKACEYANADVLVYLSDDFDCPDNWDKLIMERIDLSVPQLIKVDDCLQPFNVKVLTIPIMNRKLYDKLGYFWHPDYKSMFVDEDLYHTCANNGWMKLCPELKFEHKHACVGKAENDETYIRSSANWDQGKEAFRKRQLAGFPL